MTVPRILKRYANRRLYDTVLKRYVTLAHVSDLVLAHEHVSVMDSDEQTDVTPRVLLQAIVAAESAGRLRLDAQVLVRVIRSAQRSGA